MYGPYYCDIVCILEKALPLTRISSVKMDHISHNTGGTSRKTRASRVGSKGITKAESSNPKTNITRYLSGTIARKLPL